jgi:hypothetical protein
MLAGQAVRIADGLDSSHQNWFQRSNRFAAAVFGTFVDRADPNTTSLLDYQLLQVPFDAAATHIAHCVTVAEAADDAHLRGLAQEFAQRTRGPVYTIAEDLADEDIDLQQVDRLYQLVGLRRYRRVHLAFDGDEVVGLALAYRGPLGLNFSFLENRCDLLFDPRLDDRDRRRVAHALLHAAEPTYRDLPTGYIPAVTDFASAKTLTDIGATSVRSYSQSIWLRAAFHDWYDHVEGLYRDRLTRSKGPR